MSNPQFIIDAAMAAQATELGRAAAAEIFKDSMRSVLKVDTQLANSKKLMIQEMVPDVQLVFSGRHSVTHDHPVLYAFREMARAALERAVGVLNIKRRTLIMGATQREVRRYNSNPAVHYYFHMSDSKDPGRIVPDLLEDLLTMLQKKASKYNKRVFAIQSGEEPPPAVKRYESIKQMYDDYRKLGSMPPNFHFEPVEATTLVFEDSMYDVSAEQLLEYFDKTGAIEAVGYMVLPLEFYYPDMPENDIYKITERDGYITFNYRYGQSNGYCHRADTWREFGLRQVLKGDGYDLVTEITERFGPVVTFKITRTSVAKNIVRMIELPRQYHYVQLLDIWGSVDLKTGKISRPLRYYSVYAAEYYDALHWLASLAPASRKIETTVTYVRRRKDGVHLVTKELLAPWHLPDRLVHSFCLTVFIQACILAEKTDLIIENLNPTSVREKFMAFFRTIGRSFLCAVGVQYVLDLLLAEHLTDKLVKFPETAVEQWCQIDFSKVRQDPVATAAANAVAVYPEGKDTTNLPSCPVCLQLHLADLGTQKVKCEHREGTTRLEMTAAECEQWFTDLADDDADPPGLKAVKEFAKKNVPRSGFSYDVTIRHIRGRYGVGKSVLIRKLATRRDLVLAPFTKLMSDYTGLVDEHGDRYDLLFKTAHRGMAQFGAERLFVDEFPSLDFRYVMAIGYLNQVSEIWLVGDLAQTQTREPDEGWNVELHLDMSKLSTHTLMVNYRNRPDVLAVMNHFFHDEIEGVRPHKPSFTVMTIDEFEAHMDKHPLPVTKMAFTHDTRRRYDLGEKATVRACQGASDDYFALYVTNLDGSTAFVPSLQRVGLTRHREMLFIVHDGSPVAERFLDMFSRFEFTDEFVKDNQYHFEQAPHDPPTQDAVVDKVVNAETALHASELKAKLALDRVAERVKPCDPDPVKPVIDKLQSTDRQYAERLHYYASRVQVCNEQFDFWRDLGAFHVIDLVPFTAQQRPSDVPVLRTWKAYRRLLQHVARGNQVPVKFQCIVPVAPELFGLLVTEWRPVLRVGAVRLSGNDCLLRAIATATSTPLPEVLEQMVVAIGAETCQSRLDGDGFNLSDLNEYGRFASIRFKINADADSWGDNPTVVGDLTAAVVAELEWNPGHWYAESETLTNSSVSLPTGAGLSTFPSHAEFARRLNAGRSNNSISTRTLSTANGTQFLPAAYVNQFSPEFSDHINFFTGEIVEPLVMTKPDEEVSVPETYENFGLNSHELIDKIFPQAAPYHFYPAINTLESQIVVDNFRAGTVQQDIVCDVNPRRNLRKIHGFYSYGPVNSLYYEKGNQMQTLQVISERYANKHIKQFTYNKNAEVVAHAIADKCFDDCFIRDFKFDQQEFQAIMLECEKAMKEKHYEAQTDPDSPDARVVRFHLKNIAKPKVNGIPDVYKAGQGISAWSKTAQSWFGKAMRVLNARFAAALKSNVIYDNRMTEDELVARVNQELRRVHKLARRGVTDCAQFDSVQNKFTQAIERRILARLGASETFLDAYYSFRQNYVIQAGYIRTRCRYEKTSGEPGTLLLNTILSLVLTYFLYEGDGPFVIVCKGDDGFRAQLNLKINEDNLAIVNQYCQLGLKLSFEENVEFCGNVIVNGVFYPSVYRKLAKILGHRFRDYEHFCEYQVSLRDWESRVAKGDVRNLLAVNAMVYGRPVADAEAALSAIRSIAHLDKDQFHRLFQYREPVLGHMTANRCGPRYGFCFY